MLLAALQVGVVVLRRGIIIGVAVGEADGDEFLILHLLRDDEGGVAGKGGFATGQRTGSSQFLGSNGAHTGTAGGGNPGACGGSSARGCGVAAREGEVVGIADNYALYGGGIGGGFGIFYIDDDLCRLVIESQAIVRAVGGIERDVRRRGVEEVAALVVIIGTARFCLALVGLHRPRCTARRRSVVTRTVVPCRDADAVGILPVKRSGATCRTQGCRIITGSCRGVLLNVAAHLHGYRVIRSPLPVGSGGTGGGRPVHAGGEGHGVRAVGQAVAVVIGQVAARGGEQGEAA